MNIQGVYLSFRSHPLGGLESKTPRPATVSQHLEPGWMSTSASVSLGPEKRSRRDSIKAIRLKSNVDKGVSFSSVVNKAFETADFQLAMKGTLSKIGGYSTRRTQLCVPKGLETISAQPKSWTQTPSTMSLYS